MASPRSNKTLKVLDRKLGIPLVAMLGLAKAVCGLFRKRVLSEEPRRIGLLKEAAVGDTVLLSGCIKDLQARYPQAHLILFCGESNFDFAKLYEHQALSIVKLRMARPLECVRILRSFELDLLIDFGQWPRVNAVLAFFSKSRFTVGFRTPGQYRHFAYDRSVLHLSTVHETENFRNLIRSLGISPSHSPYLPPSRADSKTLPKPYMVFHLWPGGEKAYLKEWTTDAWKALYQEARRRSFSVVFTAGPEDVAKIRALFASEDVIVSEASWGETLSILQNAAQVISVNTGIMHLAAIAGVPTLGLHGPTAIKRWGPIGEKAKAIASRHPKAQYLNLGFEYPDPEMDVMKDLSVSDVLPYLTTIQE